MCVLHSQKPKDTKGFRELSATNILMATVKTAFECLIDLHQKISIYIYAHRIDKVQGGWKLDSLPENSTPKTKLHH